MANLITLANLSSVIGDTPVGSLLIDSSGDLFGTAEFGGTNDEGTAFEIPLVNGAYASSPIVLTSLGPPAGRYPPSGLIMDSAGNLFGTAHDRFVAGDGGVFEIARTASGYQNTAIPVADFP